ncbi:MAG: DNA polymerase III subunit chi [Gammaproteobacteria bacterium]
MTRIDFYLLSQPDQHHFACRVIEKAYLQKHQIYVSLPDTTTTEQFNDLLWTFGDISFIPHTILNKETTPDIPVILSHENPPAYYQDILINLTDELPTTYKQFKRVIEFIPTDEHKKALARQRYAEYREQGCELQMHKV